MVEYNLGRFKDNYFLCNFCHISHCFRVLLLRMQFLKRHRLILIGVITGALGGYAYYHFIGCSSGSCPITSRPGNSMIYGAVMGALLFSIFEKPTRTNN